MGKNAQLETNNNVLDAPTPRIDIAREKVIECKVACFNAEADSLDKLANIRQPKTDELLKQLQEWEECKYSPAFIVKVVDQPLLKAEGS